MAKDTEKDIGDAAAHHLLADSTMRDTQRYIESGRLYRSSDLENLRFEFIDRFQKWVNDLGNAEERRAVDDLTSEFHLRDEEPPFGELDEEMNILAKKTHAAFINMTEEEKIHYGTDIVMNYINSLGKKQ